MNEGKRQFERLSLYEKDVPPVKVEGLGKGFEAQLYDISPQGAGIFVSEKSWAGRELPESGLRLTLTIRLNKEEKFLVSAFVCHVAPLQKVHKRGLKLGVTFINSGGRSDVATDGHDQLAHFSQIFRPLAYAEDPMLFDEYLHFQVEAFSAQEVLLRTSKSNRSLIPGQTMTITFLLPNNPHSACKVRFLRIEGASDDASSYQIVGRWIKPAEAFKEALAEFLLIARPGLTIADMKKMGWSVTRMSRAIRFRYVNNEKDMNAVLHLRLAASQFEGRWQGMRDGSVTLDRFDSFARQVMCIVGSKTVAAARIVFNDGKKSRCEHESYNVSIPSWLWKEGFVEATQISTHPDYRGADVFHFLLQHISRIAVATEFRYLLIHCVDAMIPVYQRLGAKNLKLRFDIPTAPGARYNLMVFDCFAGAAGIGTNPLTYNLSFKKMAEFATQQGMMRLAPHHDLYRRTIGMIEPLAIHLEKRKRKARKARKAS